MNETWLVNYLRSPNTTDTQALIELKKYRAWVSDRISSQVHFRLFSYWKKKQNLEKSRLNKGFKICLEYIHKKIEEGAL